MRILVLHSQYLSGPVSGENRVVADEVQLLRESGHDVSSWQPSVAPGASSVRMAADAIWSASAGREVRRLIRECLPDVVHLHSPYPRLSPAVVRALPRDLPLVMTLHNFRLMCLPSSYLRDGSICEDCARRIPWRGVVHACYRGSRPASAVLAASLTLHRTLDTWSRVDRFLAVSVFLRDKHVEAGLDPRRVRVKSNFSWPTARREGAGGPLLFLGRIAPEKGLETIVRSVPPTLGLLVAGDGPDRPRLERLSGPQVEYLGTVGASEVPTLLRSARALVVPSRWYEGQPRVILEAFAAGVPVLASRIGGLPELVEDGLNGRLVDVADGHGWREAMESVSDDDESIRLGANAHTSWEGRFSPALAIRALEDAYGEVMPAARRRG